MLMPSIFNDNLFDDWFEFPEFPDFPDFRDVDKAERKLYGRHADRLMKTDVHEMEDHYEVDIDLPGFKKDDIKLELKDGYLTVSAAKEKETEKKGKALRTERFSGAMQRMYYVGKEMTEEDIKAKFEHGVLSLTLPKKETAKVPEKKYIAIE